MIALPDENDPRARACVKYSFVAPSETSSVSSVTDEPRSVEYPLTVIAEFVSDELAMFESVLFEASIVLFVRV